MHEPLRINAQRLRADIEALAQIGRQADHGIYRMAFSEGDLAARAWLQRPITEAGLGLHVDGAANIHARLDFDGQRPSVMTGSHIDTVPGAGHLDGALGVLAGLECLRSIKEQGVKTRLPLECVAFTDEEGRFGGILGSGVICGLLTPERIHNARDLKGVSIEEAMAACGLNAMDALHAARRPESLHAFVELHIEQGPVLDRSGVGIGVVDAIAGLFKWEVRLIGVANHAGTTPMDLRQDAFQGLAEFATEIPRILEEHGTRGSRATIGRVQPSPGAANVVPGRVDFSLDVRDTSPEILLELSHALTPCAARSRPSRDPRGRHARDAAGHGAGPDRLLHRRLLRRRPRLRRRLHGRRARHDLAMAGRLPVAAPRRGPHRRGAGMTLSAEALTILVSVALGVTVIAPLALVALFIIDWRSNRLW